MTCVEGSEKIEAPCKQMHDTNRLSHTHLRACFNDDVDAPTPSSASSYLRAVLPTLVRKKAVMCQPVRTKTHTRRPLTWSS